MLVGSRHYDHYLNNSFENFTADLIYNHLQSGTLFIDIGAHYGYYTLLAGTKYPENKIIAFEPEPSNYDLLKKNIEMNKLTNVDIYNLAVSNEEGIKEFAVAEHSSRSGFYEPYLSNILKKINVKTVVIDNVVKDDIPLKIMIKIDAEGHEIFIIEGMRRLLESTKDVELFIEYNPDMIKKSGNRPEKLLETLNQCGFDIYIIDDERRLTFKLDGLKNYQRYFDDHNFNKNYCNLLCIKSERSLNLCIFSHSSMLAGSERGLLELTAGLINEYQALYHYFT
jgi:FkbM family methyltransferase